MMKLLLAEINKHVQSFAGPINKQVWKNIAASMNTHGYNLSAENCNLKWTGMKKKYKMLKDANNKTGAAKQTWEYYNIINEMLIKRPEIEPLSIASSSRGFQLNRIAVKMSENNNDENDEENVSESSNFTKSRRASKRKSQIPVWVEVLSAQRESHHKSNYAQRERFLSL